MAVPHLSRCFDVPIIEPRGDDWEAIATFNCAAVRVNSRIHVFYRAVGDYVQYASNVGYAVFDEDLRLVRRLDDPVFGPDLALWEMSIEDARITEVEGEHYMTYVVTPTPSPPGAVRRRIGLPKPRTAQPRVALARVTGWDTPEGLQFERLGIITPYHADERDVVIFPQRIQGHYAAIHRPSNWVGPEYGVSRPSMWFAWLDGLPGRMFGHRVIMEPEQPWEATKIGVGPPPVWTEKGWLVIYHGVDEHRVYRAGAVLLDLEEPWRVLGRTRNPILVPERPWEVEGDVPNVVFPEGAVVLGEDLLVFYGAADKVCGVARVRVDDLVDSLLQGGNS